MTRPTPSRKTLPVNMYLGCTRLMTMPARIAPISVPAPPTAASGPYKEALTCRFRLTKMMSSAFIAPAPSMAIRARITTMSSTRVFATKRKPTSISRNTAPMALSGTAVVAASAKRGYHEGDGIDQHGYDRPDNEVEWRGESRPDDDG